MPRYSYRCGCGEEFEKSRPMSEYKEPAECPRCGKLAAKSVSAVALSGFNNLGQSTGRSFG